MDSVCWMCVYTKSSYRDRTPVLLKSGVKAGFASMHCTASMYEVLAMGLRSRHSFRVTTSAQEWLDEFTRGSKNRHRTVTKVRAMMKMVSVSISKTVAGRPSCGRNEGIKYLLILPWLFCFTHICLIQIYKGEPLYVGRKYACQHPNAKRNHQAR